MLLLGITGLISDQNISKLASILIIILGIIAFMLGALSLTQPLYAAILIGVCLIMQGVRLFLTE